MLPFLGPREDLAPSFYIDSFLSLLVVIILGVDTDVAVPRVRGGLGPHPLCFVESVSGCPEEGWVEPACLLPPATQRLSHHYRD